MTARRILALGGGGFSMEPDNRLLDDFLLSLAPAGRLPRVCFVPTASGDSRGYVESFSATFGPDRADTSVLSLFERTLTDLDAFVAAQDVVYVGGGSTANLLALWRLHGLDEALRKGYEAGVVMAGVSAGMNCWFEASVTDSFHMEHLQPLSSGLGWLSGSACPHYDSEAQRRPTYQRLIAGGFPAGYAAEDGVGLLFEDGQLAEAVSSRPGAQAFHVGLGADGDVVERAIRTRYLG